MDEKTCAAKKKQDAADILVASDTRERTIDGTKGTLLELGVQTFDMCILLGETPYL